MGYEPSICRHYFNDGDESSGLMYVLRQGNSKSFMEDCARTDRTRLASIVKTAKRIYDHGCSFGFDSGTIKRIRAGKIDIDVFETRVNGSVIRIATYIHNGWIPIYLFDFDTHQGSGNNLQQRHIARAVAMALTARDCAANYDFSEYAGRR